MPQTLGSRPESLSRLRFPPRLVQCLEHEVTLKEESKIKVSLEPRGEKSEILGQVYLKEVSWEVML